MSFVKLYLPEDALQAASSEVLIFVIRQLESEAVRLKVALDESEARFRTLETKHESVLDQSYNDIYDLHQRVEAEELKRGAATQDLEQAKISNNQLEIDNEGLRLEIDMLKTRIYGKFWNGPN